MFSFNFPRLYTLFRSAASLQCARLDAGPISFILKAHSRYSAIQSITCCLHDALTRSRAQSSCRIAAMSTVDNLSKPSPTTAAHTI
eukprot:scaffold434108_cov18-Prasinocladus_malaysianus.AAC.1